jgi:hypothetical protein
MHRYHDIAVLIAFAAGAACHDIAPDGTGLVIEALAEQPHSAELGVSLLIHARGGGSVHVSVEEGVFLAAAAGPGQVPAAQQASCLSSVTPPPHFTFALSVRPAHEEALLFVSLYAQDDCTGEVLQSRIVAVHPPALNPVSLDAAAAGLEVR